MTAPDDSVRNTLSSSPYTLDVILDNVQLCQNVDDEDRQLKENIERLRIPDQWRCRQFTIKFPVLKHCLRMIAALIAALGVLLPMIIMVVFVPGMENLSGTGKGNIAVVSAAVLIYCAVMVFSFRSNSQELMVAVAAYAAVLVVFLGTQPGNNQLEIAATNSTVTLSPDQQLNGQSAIVSTNSNVTI